MTGEEEFGLDSLSLKSLELGNFPLYNFPESQKTEATGPGGSGVVCRIL